MAGKMDGKRDETVEEGSYLRSRFEKRRGNWKRGRGLLRSFPVRGRSLETVRKAGGSGRWIVWYNIALCQTIQSGDRMATGNGWRMGDSAAGNGALFRRCCPGALLLWCFHVIGRKQLVQGPGVPLLSLSCIIVLLHVCIQLFRYPRARPKNIIL